MSEVVSERTTVRRYAHRAAYDRPTIDRNLLPIDQRRKVRIPHNTPVHAHAALADPLFCLAA